MNTYRDVVDLLEPSLEAMRQQVLPQLTGEARTTVLMVANAIGIALRVLELGSAQDAQDLEGLQSLVPGQPEDLSALRQSLVQEIRAGAFDPEFRPEEAARLESYLLRSVLGHCAIDQPRAIPKAKEATP
ncbi:DUF6285 domain-containing protein [Polaromonas sp. P2-4]|nr:DUF6285 domain-containing protein [Polaromonas sp. P2-4]